MKMYSEVNKNSIVLTVCGAFLEELYMVICLINVLYEIVLEEIISSLQSYYFIKNLNRNKSIYTLKTLTIK